MSCVGFSTLGTFASLWVSEKGWGQPWLAFTAFSLVFVATRMAGGRLPDRMGGARVAAVSALVEALGQLCMGVALDEDTLVAGAVLTGMGYALVFPGLGLVALRAIQPQSRALAMGTYTAFLDLTLAFSIPLLGWLAEYAGLQSVFLVASLCALASALVSFGIAVRSAKSTA
jgi:MFS family permease